MTSLASLTGGGGGGDPLSEMLGGLSLAQISSSHSSGPISLAQTGSKARFDPNPKDGKDADGFDEEILISDDNATTNGMKDALNYDPLSS